MTKETAEFIFSMAEDEVGTRIVAIGIGGMGRNAMENIAAIEIDGLELYSVNTDMQALDKCVGSQPVQIGGKRTGGKGAGGNNEVGKLSAEDDIEKLRGLVEGAELVFITAGMGGGTGTGAAPVIAELCRSMGILTIGIVTTPMKCEGRKRMAKAQQGLAELRRQIDSLVVIENEKLSLVMDHEDVSIIEVFRRADEVLLKSVAAIGGMINFHGYINLDLADLGNVLKRPSAENCTDALIGVGTASGEGRALKAAASAMDNPLLANSDINGAINLLINVSGNENMGLNEAHSVVQAIADKAGEGDREIFMGIVTDNSLGESISVTLIATGMGPHQPGLPAKPRLVAIKADGGSLAVASRGGTGAAAWVTEEKPAGFAEINNVYRHKAGAGNTENFGSSPLVKSQDWQTPAYTRRDCRYTGQVIEEVLARDPQTDSREEARPFKRPRTGRIYGEPALRLAC
jgi:cell division protein FtsZ